MLYFRELLLLYNKKDRLLWRPLKMRMPSFSILVLSYFLISLFLFQPFERFFCQEGQTKKGFDFLANILTEGSWGWSGIRPKKSFNDWVKDDQIIFLIVLLAILQKIPQVWGFDLWVVILFGAHQQRCIEHPNRSFVPYWFFCSSHRSCICCFRASTCQNAANPLSEDTAVKRSSTAEFHLLNEKREGGRILWVLQGGWGRKPQNNKRKTGMTETHSLQFSPSGAVFLFCSLPPFVWSTL